MKRPGRPFLNVCGTLLAYFISSGKIQTDYSQLIAAFPPDDLLWFHSRDPRALQQHLLSFSSAAKIFRGIL